MKTNQDPQGNVKPFSIAGRAVDLDSPPFVIAEISGNHGGSIDMAKALIDAAVTAGADAVKFQTYTADSMTLDSDAPEFRVSEEGSLWQGETLFSLYTRAHTPWEWHGELFAYARERGLVAFSSPFDKQAVFLLERLECPCYKIASFEITDHELIKAAAQTGKPLIVSTGMASLVEIAQAVQVARESGAESVSLLKCTSSYPAHPVDANLATIPVLGSAFDCPVGLSDHSIGVGVAAAAVALGASLIEKHITLSRIDGAVDSAFSAVPEEFEMLVKECRNAWLARGSVHFGPSDGERASLKYRRSLYVVQDIAAGQPLTSKNVRALRPGLGLAPYEWPYIEGRLASHDLRRGSAVSWDSID